MDTVTVYMETVYNSSSSTNSTRNRNKNRKKLNDTNVFHRQWHWKRMKTRTGRARLENGMNIGINNFFSLNGKGFLWIQGIWWITSQFIDPASNMCLAGTVSMNSVETFMENSNKTQQLIAHEREGENPRITRLPQYKNVYRRTIEMPQRAHIFKVNCSLKVHNSHLKLLSPISG